MNNFYNTEIADTEEKESNELYLQWKRRRTAKYLISSILALTGILILLSQLGPLGMSYIQGILMEKQVQSIKDPAPAQELDPDNSDLPYYDPGMSYFQNLIDHIGSPAVAGAQSPGTDSIPNENIYIDENYGAAMQLSIPSIGINKINITPNVDSFNDTTYNRSLKKGLAHFKGTPLPGDGGNCFIYGHSAIDTFFSRNQDEPETIFSRLENVEIADTITIEKDGKMMTYVVQKKKITEPNDFEVISDFSRKETVTLMTCWPLGIGTKRLIVIGELTDG